MAHEVAAGRGTSTTTTTAPRSPLRGGSQQHHQESGPRRSTGNAPRSPIHSQQHRPRSASTPTRKLSETTPPTLPKFGEWVSDPSSVDEYSAIFGKAMDEKRRGGFLPDEPPLPGRQQQQQQQPSATVCGGDFAAASRQRRRHESQVTTLLAGSTTDSRFLRDDFHCHCQYIYKSVKHIELVHKPADLQDPHRELGWLHGQGDGRPNRFKVERSPCSMPVRMQEKCH